MATEALPERTNSLVPSMLLVLVVWGCAIYANLSFAVTQPAEYRWFPPFRPNVDENENRQLGGEYFTVARSLLRGQGFAHPFDEAAGPTAWVPPALPTLLAGLLWLCDGERDSVAVVVVFLQVLVLIATGLLVLTLARQTTRQLGSGLAVAVFLAGALSDFHLWFQNTSDCWLVLLAIDLLLVGWCWFAPLRGWRSATAWGLLGGLCALVNPVVGFAWGTSTLVVAFRQKVVFRLAVAVLIAGLTLAPWSVRNYRVFGRLIPVKSNVGYELYQSQCLQSDGLLKRSALVCSHPFAQGSQENREYLLLGEIAFVERKREQFREAVWTDPLDFLARVGHRFLGATLWYEPFDPDEEHSRAWRVALVRLIHPLPFVALLILLALSRGSPLGRPQWIVIGVYLLYLLPYVGISYYERYAVPLLGAKALLVLWAADRLVAREKPLPASSPSDTLREDEMATGSSIHTWTRNQLCVLPIELPVTQVAVPLGARSSQLPSVSCSC